MNFKLKNSLQLFDFYSECEDFNKWMKDKSKAIAADENDVAKVSKAFEKFLTANKKLLEHIDAEAVILPKDVSGQARKTHKLYDGLVKLQKQPENLEASVILSQKSCKYL